MKKPALIFILILFSTVIKAQRGTNNFELGFTLSPNIGWLSADSRASGGNSGVSNDGVRPGFTYGVLADLGFAPNYYFSTGFTISTINGQLDYGEAYDSPSTVYKVRYLEVPLTLKLKSRPSPSGRFYGQFGLGTGVKIGAKADIREEGTAQEENVDVSSDVNTFRLSMLAGLGMEWNINGNFNLQTGVTLNNGFTKALPRTKNSYLALNIGFFF